MVSEEELKAFEEMAKRSTEPLHPDLVPYAYQDPQFGRCIKHPLVISLIAPPQMDWMLNQQYTQKVEAIKEYTESENWNGYVWMHERPWRLEALMGIADNIEDNAEYWNLVSSIWTDSENIHENYNEWMELLNSDRPGREAMMDEDDTVALSEMPEELHVYRGYTTTDDYDGICGYSWTLDEERAAWFAKRLRRPHETPILASASVMQWDVIAYFDGRGEREIVVMPWDVQIIDKVDIS